MKKRGDSQLDWIMSLALFLLYVGWFFVFISPNLSFGSNKDSMMILLKNNFYNEFRWQLKEFPVFIESNITGRSIPVIINFSASDMKFRDDTDFIIWRNNLIFIADFSSSTATYWVLEGYNFTNTYQYGGLNVEEDSVSTENLTVNYDQSMPVAATYTYETRFENIRYNLNGESFAPTNTTYIDHGFVVEYASGTQDINHTSFIFANSPGIYNFITLSNPESTYVLQLSIDLDNYPSYYSSNLYYGTLNYANETNNLNFSSNYLTLYNSEDSLSMFFDGSADFNFTYYNNSLHLDITFPVGVLYEYRFIFHEGNFTIASSDNYDIRFGSEETLEGIYENNITTNYTYLKNKWKFPSTRNFNIVVYSGTTAQSYLEEPLYEIGEFSPGRRSVYAESDDSFILNEDGTYTPVSINYRIW